MPEKEIGKLLELLNEYCIEEEIKWKWNFVPNHLQWEGCDNSECSDLLIISKKFGFIQRLVEQDKIDLEKLRDLDISDNFNYEYFNKNKSDFLISLLSISDTPIEDLISYLK